MTLEQLKRDADEALETLRDLARGIYPPLLADKGLVVALEAQARKATVPVRVEAEGVERYAQDVEATVYFCVLEALQNVQKYAKATRVALTLREEGGALRSRWPMTGPGSTGRQRRREPGSLTWPTASKRSAAALTFCRNRALERAFVAHFKQLRE